MNRYDRTQAALRTYDRTELLIMPKRQEAAIFMTMKINSPQLRTYLKEKQLRFFSMVLYACLVTVTRHPIMRRFVMGQKVYDHKRWWVSTVIKKDKTNESTNHMSKFEMKEGMSPRQIQDVMDGLIAATKQDQLHEPDKLIHLLAHLPGFIFTIAIKLAAWLDRMDLLPNGLIKADPLHTGVLIANLGSISGQSVTHHLFNWGTCSLVITVGTLSESGEVDLSFSIDERIGEGVAFFRALETFKAVLEDPYAFDE